MNRRELKERLKAEAIEEARLDEQTEAQAEKTLQKWKCATAIWGTALLAVIVGVIPFLAGEPFHNRWETIGKKFC